jgi:DNA-binding NtrC family response regulator
MGKHARILVVDDDENIRITIKAILENEGYTVDVAEDGREATEKAQRTAYNVALIDIRLPDMDGTELLTSMKDTVPKIRKIILTGYPSMQNAVEAVNRGADAYLVKPVDVATLLELVREQLKLQEAEKRYSEQKVADFIESRAKEISTAKR